MIEPWQLIALAAIGVIGGMLNVLAGGGSLLTMPVMVLMGIPGPTANGTNRIAILAQNLSAITSFKKRGFSDFKLSLTLALASVPGALLGAYTGTLVRGVLFNRILAVIMIAVIASMIFKQLKKKKESKPAAAGVELTRTRLILGHICMIGVGFYGGFIQAGVGFLLMAALHQVMGLDLVRVNMHKVFIVAVYTIAALIVYIVRGHVLWIVGLTLAIGMSIGGWLGAKMSVDRGENFIRIVLYIALTVMAVKLLMP